MLTSMRLRERALLCGLVACCAFALAFLAPAQSWAAERAGGGGGKVIASTTSAVNVSAGFVWQGYAATVYDASGNKGVLFGSGTVRPGYQAVPAKGAIEASNSIMTTGGKDGKLFIDDVEYTGNVNWSAVWFVSVRYEMVVHSQSARINTYITCFDKNWGNMQILHRGPQQIVPGSTNGKLTKYSCTVSFEGPAPSAPEALNMPSVETTFADGTPYAPSTWANRDVRVRAVASQAQAHPYTLTLFEKAGSYSQLGEASGTGSLATAWTTVGETSREGREFTGMSERNLDSQNDSVMTFPFVKVLVDKTKPVAKVSLGSDGRLVDESTDALSGVRSTEVGIAGGSYVSIADAPALSPGSVHTVRVRVTDNAGNVTETVVTLGSGGGSGGDPDPGPGGGSDPDVDPGSRAGDGFSARRYVS